MGRMLRLFGGGSLGGGYTPGVDRLALEAVPVDTWGLEDASGAWDLEDSSGDWLIELAVVGDLFLLEDSLTDHFLLE